MNIQEQHPSSFNNAPKKSATVLRWGFLAVPYYVAFFLFALVARQLPAFFHTPQPDGSLPSMLLPLVTAWSGATIAISIIFRVSRKRDAARVTNRELLAFLGGGMAIDLACNFMALKLTGRAGTDILEAGAGALAPLVLLATANLGVLAAAIGLGLLMARGLKKPSYLITAAIVGALTDIFSVYAGPSKHVLSSDVFPYVSYQWGIAGQGVMPCVGAGDFIFLCLFFAGVRRFGLDDRKTFFAMIAAIGLGYLSIAFSPKGIPALPFMAALLLLAHGRELKIIQAASNGNDAAN